MNDRFNLSWLFLFIRVGTTFFAALYILSRSRTPNLAQCERTGWRGGTEMSMVLSRSQVMWVPGDWAGHLTSALTTRKGALWKDHTGGQVRCGPD